MFFVFESFVIFNYSGQRGSANKAHFNRTFYHYWKWLVDLSRQFTRGKINTAPFKIKIKIETFLGWISVTCIELWRILSLWEFSSRSLLLLIFLRGNKLLKPTGCINLPAWLKQLRGWMFSPCVAYFDIASILIGRNLLKICHIQSKRTLLLY